MTVSISRPGLSSITKPLKQSSQETSIHRQDTFSLHISFKARFHAAFNPKQDALLAECHTYARTPNRLTDVLVKYLQADPGLALQIVQQKQELWIITALLKAIKKINTQDAADGNIARFSPNCIMDLLETAFKAGSLPTEPTLDTIRRGFALTKPS